MKFLIIDSCVWLELAEKPPLRPLLQRLKNVLEKEGRELVLPGPVLLEYERNRSRISENWIKSLQSHMKHLNGLKPVLQNVQREIALIQEAGRAEIEEARKVIPANLKDIDGIFEVARVWEADDKHFKDACSRNINFMPPAHVPQRSSVGDCLIWAAVLDLLDEGEVWFCSANSSDFSSPLRKDEAHPELVAEAAAKGNGFRYFNDPTKLIESLIEELPKKSQEPAASLPLYFDYVPSPPSSCAKCGSRFYEGGAFLNSHYGGLTLQYICRGCGSRFDTGEPFD